MGQEKLNKVLERLDNETTTKGRNKLIYTWIKQNYISLKEFNLIMNIKTINNRLLRVNCEYDQHDECDCMGKYCEYGN